MKKLFVVLGLLTFCFKSYAQSGLDNILLKDLQIRQTFETTDGKFSPAQIQISIPDNGKSNYLIDAGLALKLDFLKLKSITSYITGEYHYNTLINLPQNNYQFGYNLRWFERSDNPNRNWRNIIIGNLKYIRDQVYSTNSFAAIANWTLYNKSRTGLQLNHPGYLAKGTDNFHYTYNLTPYLGAQYQQFFNSTVFHSGSIARALVNVSGAIALNKKYDADASIKQPQKNIEFFADFIARYAMINTTNPERYTKRFKSGINYYFINTPKVSVSIGGNYNLGSDPLHGLKDQQYWQIAFQLQI